MMLSGLLIQSAGQAKKLIVIDPLATTNSRDTGDYESGQKIIMLPGEGNPVNIIAEELNKAYYDEIHIYVLTKPGSLIFDEINIIPENIGDYSAAFKNWKAGLNVGCRIILHSEDLLTEQGGEVITGSIGEYTGCKVTVAK